MMGWLVFWRILTDDRQLNTIVNRLTWFIYLGSRYSRIESFIRQTRVALLRNIYPSVPYGGLYRCRRGVLTRFHERTRMLAFHRSSLTAARGFLGDCAAPIHPVSRRFLASCLLHRSQTADCLWVAAVPDAGSVPEVPMPN